MGKGEKVVPIAENRDAKHRYDLLERYEAGIVLEGPEVKSLRSRGTVSFKDSFVRVEDGEAWLHNLYIAPYRFATVKPPDPMRKRKLLLHKREIMRLYGRSREKGYTIIPTRIYWKNNLVKVEIALAKGKKLHDRRQELKEKAVRRELERELKGKLRL
ncbi:MAG: SsrA-binding protein SmpB [Aquificota bacterium]|nr:SsrA-binding protein SmpB [Aquificota bacterium]MDQ7082815.1 SsrA-binding protein SmpB [Aquificota bacterium]